MENNLGPEKVRGKTAWYVVFSSNDVKPHWLHRFMKKPFLHCYCFRQIGDFIYWANPTTSNIDTKIFLEIDASVFAHSLKFVPNTRVLTFYSDLDFSNKIFNLWNIAPTCVSVVKMFLGISCRAQTPYQLFKHLLKLGATEDSIINVENFLKHGKPTKSTGQ